jgi:hypothetical protein
VVFTLPAAPAIGDLVQLSGAGAWVLAPNGNQSIVQNTAGTGALTGGALTGSQGDSVTVQYVGTNTFLVTSFVGHTTALNTTFFAQGGVLWTPPNFSIGYNWAQGTAYCAGASFGGLSGWRMPTATELLGLDTYGVLGTHGWPSVTGNMWTSTPDTASGAGYYMVEAFGYRVAAGQNGSNNLYVTCVR